MFTQTGGGNDSIGTDENPEGRNIGAVELGDMAVWVSDERVSCALLLALGPNFFHAGPIGI